MVLYKGGRVGGGKGGKDDVWAGKMSSLVLGILNWRYLGDSLVEIGTWVWMCKVYLGRMYRLGYKFGDFGLRL